MTIDKTYRLKSRALSEDVSGFEINGTGTWVFNRELGISESLDFKQKLVVQKGNTAITLPMTIQYSRMSEAELAQYQEESRKRLEEAKRQLAERQEKEANTPLTEKEITKFLEDLKSDNDSIVLTALLTLQRKNPSTSDPRIAMAVDALMKHDSDFVNQNAAKVAEKWPLPENVLAVTERKRTWSDQSGAFTVNAEFLELVGDQVRLRRDDGKELEVAIDRLSEADQAAVRELAKTPIPIENPFE